METILVLSHLTLVLLFGILFAMLSRRLRIPYALLLLLCGIFLGRLVYNGRPLIDFPPIFITSIGILALVLVVFDGASRFKWKEFDTLTLQASKLVISFLVANMLFLTIFTTIIFGVENVFLALIFSALMAATSAEVVLSMFKNQSNKVTNLLEVESILNTPLTVLLPFIIITVMENIQLQDILVENLMVQLLTVVQQFITGIGAGVIMGIIVFKVMRRYYSHNLSPLILITCTLMTYLIAEHTAGNGVVAVTVLGLFFGNFYVKNKQTLFEFSSTFGNSLMILVFILVGMKIDLPFTDVSFMLRSLALFGLYVAIRSMAVYVCTINSDYTNREKVFMTLNFPKGIAVAVIAFSLVSYRFAFGALQNTSFVSLPGAELILNLILTFMLFSIALSTIVNHFSKFFIKVDVVNDQARPRRGRR